MSQGTTAVPLWRAPCPGTLTPGRAGVGFALKAVRMGFRKAWLSLVLEGLSETMGEMTIAPLSRSPREPPPSQTPRAGPPPRPPQAVAPAAAGRSRRSFVCSFALRESQACSAWALRGPRVLPPSCLCAPAASVPVSESRTQLFLGDPFSALNERLGLTPP